MRASAAPLVSVIMAAYNPGRFFAPAIRGVLRQTFKDWELVIVDDGSTDGSAALAERVAKADSRVRYIRQANSGVVAARNRAIREARAPLLAINDSDDVSKPDRLRRQWDFLNDHPDHVAVGSAIRLIDPLGRDVGRAFTLTDHDVIDAYHLSTATAGIAHSTSMIRAEAFRRLGGYRPGFDPSEDFDLWLRLAEVGRLSNLPDALVEYRLHAGSLSNVFSNRQRANALRAVADACARRGLPRPPSEAGQPAGRVTSPCVHWANLALASGHYSAARRLSASGVRATPRSPAAWYIFLTACFGSHYQHAQNSIRQPAASLLRLLRRR